MATVGETPVLPGRGDAGSSARAARSQKLEAACRAAGMTEGGTNWAIHAMDPMRDDDSVEAAGFPSADRSHSIVSEIITETAISAPATGGPYDLHIASSGILYAQGSDNADTGEITQRRLGSLGSPYNVSLNSSDAPGAVWPATALIYSLVPAGTPTFPNGTAPVPAPDATHIYGGLDILGGGQSAIASGNRAVRIASWGVETLNVTPALTRGGLLLAYQQPTVTTVDQTRFSAAAGSGVTAYGTTPSIELPAPPTDAPAARLLHGSVEWASERGTYQVGCFSDVENPFSYPRAMPAVWDGVTGDAIDYAIVTSITFSDQAATTTAPTTRAIMANPNLDGVQIGGMDQFGVMHLGIQAGSTIILRSRAVVELAVESSDGFLTTLAKMSTPYDPIALGLVAKIMREAPCAVPVDENASGDWLEKIAGLVKYAAPIAGALFPEAIPLIAGGEALLNRQVKQRAIKAEAAAKDPKLAAKMEKAAIKDEAKAQTMLAQVKRAGSALAHVKTPPPKPPKHFAKK